MAVVGYLPEGEQPSVQNAPLWLRSDSLWELMDVLGGAAFSRVSKWGRRIETLSPNEAYL